MRSPLAGIPEKDIVGFRAPDLQYNDDMLSVLQERGFLYDSSIPYDGTSFYFPYTLDFGAREQSWKTNHVKTPHPSLWEYPLPTLMNEDFSVNTVQDPNGSKEEIIELLKRNFGDCFPSWMKCRFALQLKPISLYHLAHSLLASSA